MWLLLFFINLPFPIIAGLVFVRPTTIWALGLAIFLLFVSGIFLCRFAPKVMRMVQRGAALTAALQLLPFPHIIIGFIGLSLVDALIGATQPLGFDMGPLPDKGLNWPSLLFLGMFTGSALAFVAFVFGCLLQLVIPDKRISNEAHPGENDFAS